MAHSVAELSVAYVAGKMCGLACGQSPLVHECASGVAFTDKVDWTDDASAEGLVCRCPLQAEVLIGLTHVPYDASGPTCVHPPTSNVALHLPLCLFIAAAYCLHINQSVYQSRNFIWCIDAEQACLLHVRINPP